MKIKQGRTFGEALKRRQGLAAVPLLDTDMNVVRLRPDVLGAAKRVSLVCEGICLWTGKRDGQQKARSISAALRARRRTNAHRKC